MIFIDKETVNSKLSIESLIAELDKGFSQDFSMPKRQVFELDPTSDSHSAFALLPAWNDEVIGVKAFTYFPENRERETLKTLYSNIMLFSRKTGAPLAMLDGTSITYWRTACASALASKYLSRKNSKNLLFLGTGNLALYMISAHLAVRDIKEVSIWGRNSSKVDLLLSRCIDKFPEVNFIACESLEPASHHADIISSATGASQPLILGKWLSPGCHLDFVGNHNIKLRECDSDAVVNSRFFADSRENVLNEAGELLIPISEGRINKDHLLADLSALTRGFVGRKNDSDITFYKSVGTALSDLIAANYVAKQVL